MNPERIIEVTYDEVGKSSYRISIGPLSTRDYGEILATLLRLIARMMATEGGFEEKEIERDLMHHFNREIREPSTHTSMNQLQ